MRMQIPNRMNLGQIRQQMKNKNVKAIEWLEKQEQTEECIYIKEMLKEINKKV